MKLFRTYLTLFLIMTLLLGGAYPLVVTLMGKSFFREKAAGSFVEVKGHLVGSNLIAQGFTTPQYFWPRPSACGYGMPSGGSNLSPGSKTLQAQVASKNNLPADLVFASGSGLDPDISPASALAQVDRVAEARHLSVDQKKTLVKLVNSMIQHRQWRVFGEERVNILALNKAVDTTLMVQKDI